MLCMTLLKFQHVRVTQKKSYSRQTASRIKKESDKNLVNK